MILYTKENCKPCADLKAWLNLWGVEFQEIKIEENEHLREEKGLDLFPAAEHEGYMYAGLDAVMSVGRRVIRGDT